MHYLVTWTLQNFFSGPLPSLLVVRGHGAREDGRRTGGSPAPVGLAVVGRRRCAAMRLHPPPACFPLLLNIRSSTHELPVKLVECISGTRSILKWKAAYPYAPEVGSICRTDYKGKATRGSCRARVYPRASCRNIAVACAQTILEGRGT